MLPVEKSMSADVVEKKGEDLALLPKSFTGDENCVYPIPWSGLIS